MVLTYTANLMANLPTKIQLRLHYLQQLKGLNGRLKADYDHYLNKALQQFAAVNNCQSIHCYLPMVHEVNLEPSIAQWLQASKTVVCPKTLPKGVLENRPLASLRQLEKGVFNTRHPATTEIYRQAYDLIVVPGLVFTQAGNRLGYGGGYYDRFLAQSQFKHALAVAYPFQIAQHLPVENHDVALEKILVAPAKNQASR
jgi:5-formyltetrahydrofolate cyclo-ligase